MSTSKINVYFRKKPFVQLIQDDLDIIKTKENNIYVKNLKPRVSKKSQYVHYNMPLLSEDLKNVNIFEKTISSDYKNQKNILLMAYGQTGSGKTHTLCGSKNEDGIIPIVIKNLLRDGRRCNVKVLEVYRNTVYDLLSQSKQQLLFYEVNKRLQYKSDPIEKEISSFDNLEQTMTLITKNKQMGCTKINNTSSRAHTIYYFLIDNNQKFIAIDLAGNERGYLTNAKNSIENQEYISINQSLFALKECIRSIFLNKPYVPFRRSKLTLLLRDILNKSMNIHFIGTLNPSRLCYPDIVDTIEYGTCLKHSKLKKLLKHVPSEQFLILPKIQNNLDIDCKNKERPVTSQTLDKKNKYIRNIKSEPSVNNNKTLLELYNKFIINHYTLARKHIKIYNDISKNNIRIPYRKINALVDHYNKLSEFLE